MQEKKVGPRELQGWNTEASGPSWRGRWGNETLGHISNSDRPFFFAFHGCDADAPGVGSELDPGTRTEELRVQASERLDGNMASLYSFWLCELEPLECPF